MKKYTYKVLTYFDFEIIAISLIFLVLSFFSVKYLISNKSQINKYTEEMINNQNKITDITKSFNDYLIADQIIFTNSFALIKKENISGLDSSIVDIKRIYNSEKIDSLTKSKKILFESIKLSTINISNTKKEDVKPIVSKTHKKRAFWYSDVVNIKYQKFLKIDEKMLREEIKRVRLQIDSTVTRNAEINAEINLEIKHEISNYTNEIENQNVQKRIFIEKKINSNLKKFTILSLILSVSLILFIFFLIHDIRKKIKSERRDKMVVDELINLKK